MEISGAPLFCPRCGTANTLDATACSQCGQDLRLVAAAIQRHSDPSRRPGRLAARWSSFRQQRRLWGAVFALVLIASLGAWATRQAALAQEERARIEAQAAHYLNGVWASEVGRWDLAVAEFGAAGNYRDAAERQAQAERRLNQVEERYLSARQAFNQGRRWQAAYDFHQVVSALPQFRDAGELLAEARRALGDLLLFESGRGTNAQVILSSADGGQQHPLLEADLASSAEFASDAQSLLVETVRNGKNDLWLFHPPDGEPQLLVTDARDVWGRFSPDGQWLLFAWWASNGWYLSMIPAVGGSPTEVLRQADFVTADFSPDSTQLSYWARTGGTWRLGLATLASLEQTDLVNDADSFGTLEFSPDGHKVAFGYTRAGQQYLEVASVDGNDRHQLAPGASYAWTRFSPAGKHLLVWSWRGGSEPTAQQPEAAKSVPTGQLLLTDLQGSVLREIATGPADAWGEWSPDGRHFVYGSWNGRTWRVTLATADGSQSTVLAEGSEDAQALFAPKGRWLLVALSQDTRWQLLLRDLTDGSERVLVSGASYATALFAPDNEHLLVWYIPDGETGATLTVAEAATGRRITLAQNLLAAQGAFARDGSSFGVALQPTSGARPQVSIGSVDGTTFLEFAPAGYRLYWARTPFQFGPRPPEPVMTKEG
jgi:Tol biopolymer transport system component